MSTQESPAVPFPLFSRPGLMLEKYNSHYEAQPSRSWSAASSQQRSHFDRKTGKFLSPVVNTNDVMVTTSCHFKFIYIPSLVGHMILRYPLKEGWSGARNEEDGFYARPQEDGSRERRDGVTRPCGLDSGPGSPRHPRLQEGETQCDPVNSDHWN